MNYKNAARVCMGMNFVVVFAALGVSPACPSENAPESVEVRRDHSGVPHVYADSAEPLFFGAGYALAGDRLAEWELTRRSARGRLAEILGPSALEDDKTARTRDHTDDEWLKIFSALPAEHRSILLCYLAGLNQRIYEIAKDPTHKTPYEFKKWGIRPKPWSVADYVSTLALSYKYYGTGGGGHEPTNAAFRDYLVNRYAPTDVKAIFNDALPLSDDDAIPIIRQPTESHARVMAAPPGNEASAELFAQYEALTSSDGRRRALLGQKMGASRSVVIGPRRSANGHVLMLQSTADGPDIHIVGAGFDSAGFTLPVSPVPIMGRGPTFGWLITTGEEDVVDTFVEQLNPANLQEYKYQGAWKVMDIRTETIRARGSHAVNIQVARTVHGPVITTDPHARVAYSEQGVTWGHELDDVVANIDLARAHSLDDVALAVSHLRGSFNVQYGGEDGTIAHWHAGAVPIRAAGVDPRLPTPGTGEYDWVGTTTFADWPKVVNPAEGYLHVWNNKATSASSYGDSSRYGATYRTYMARAIVESSPPLTVDAMKGLNRAVGESAGGYDLSLTSPSFFVPELLKAVQGDERLTAAVHLMQTWDGRYHFEPGASTYDSPGLTIFREWIGTAQALIVAPVIGEWWKKLDQGKYIQYRTELLYRIIARDRAHTALTYDWFQGRDRAAVLRETVAKSVQSLEAQFQTADMSRWRTSIYYKYYDSSAKSAHADHPSFPDASDEWGGTKAGSLGLTPAYVPNNGSEDWNALMEVSRETRAFFDVTPTGGQNQFIDSSGHGNPNIADQVWTHVHFEFKPVPMRRDEVEAATVVRFVMHPRLSSASSPH